jgi:hypothetical protein
LEIAAQALLASDFIPLLFPLQADRSMTIQRLGQESWLVSHSPQKARKTMGQELQFMSRKLES